MAGADAEQVYVGVDLATDPGPRAAEEAAARGDAARAETAPQVDSGEEQQPADEMAATTARETLGSVHDDPFLSLQESPRRHAITVAAATLRTNAGAAAPADGAIAVRRVIAVTCRPAGVLRRDTTPSRP